MVIPWGRRGIIARRGYEDEVALSRKLILSTLLSDRDHEAVGDNYAWYAIFVGISEPVAVQILKHYPAHGFWATLNDESVNPDAQSVPLLLTTYKVIETH